MDAFDSIAASLGSASALGSVGGGLRGDMLPPPPPGSGGKFNFAPNEVRAIVKDWLALADGYAASLRGSTRGGAVDGPAPDNASERHGETATRSFAAYFKSLQLKHAYCVEQAAKFQSSLDGYLGTDEASKIKLRLKEDTLPEIHERPTRRATDGGI
jgi:hypothetical protein